MSALPLQSLSLLLFGVCVNEYLTIKQFADKTGRDRAFILRLIHAERLPAVRMGSQWLIPAGAELPPDGRVKTGAYVGWRKPKDKQDGCE